MARETISLRRHTMNVSIRLLATLVALGGLAACGRQATMNDDLKHDLDQASTTSVELAPRARSTAVVSAIELGQAAEPKAETPHTTPARHAPARAKAPQPTRRTPVHVAVAPQGAEPQPVSQAPAPVADAPAPAPAPEPTVEAPAPSPTPAPVGSRGPTGDRDGDRHGDRRGRRGGWWSTGDVIRNAPFPINP
jgi:hypothetical protein